MTTYIYPPIDSAPLDIYNQEFIPAMQGFLPGYAPGSGNLDDFIGLAVAGIASGLLEIESDVATAIFRYFGAYIANLPPVAATFAQGLVTVTAVDTSGYTLPAGSDIVFTDGGGNTHGFSTVDAVTIPNGQSQATGVAVVADIAGSAANNISGTATSLVSPLAWVTSITLQAPTTNGTDAEDDDAYLLRLRTLYTVLTPKPVIAADFSTLAVQQSGVGQAITLDGYDPGNVTITANVTNLSASATNVSIIGEVPLGAPITGANIPNGTYVTGLVPASNTFIMSQAATGTAASESVTVGGSLLNGGEVSVFVRDSNGNALTSPAMATIQAALAAQQLQNFKVNVLAPTYTTVNVVVTVYAWPGQNTSSIQAAVIAAIQNYLSQVNWGIPPGGQPNPQLQAWQNDQVVRFASVEHAILAVPGVHYVTGLTLNGGSVDLPLEGAVPIASAGTVTATVNLG